MFKINKQIMVAFMIMFGLASAIACFDVGQMYCRTGSGYYSHPSCNQLIILPITDPGLRGVCVQVTGYGGDGCFTYPNHCVASIGGACPYDNSWCEGTALGANPQGLTGVGCGG